MSTENTTQIWDNPMGTDGFEFIEFATPNPKEMDTLFRTLGFTPIARHHSKNVTLYRQGDINFILNEEKESFAGDFAHKHGPSACALGFRVQNALEAHQKALALGIKDYDSKPNFMELRLPAVYGVGDSLLFFINRYGQEQNIYDIDFSPIEGANASDNDCGLCYVDHVTHNVRPGGMKKWAEFYENLFNFKQIRYFDIKGQVTGLVSKAMTSPDGFIRIPINESDNPQSQINEFIDEYNGEGIQHIAMHTDDIYETVKKLRSNGIDFMNTPDIYFNLIDKRLPGHEEDVEALREQHILIDGDPSNNEGLLLQIFTNTCIGPIFFEIIQRKGNEGFGEGNFQALFESIELDQIERGVLSATSD